MGDPGGNDSIVVCICTYRRPLQLANLLTRIDAQINVVPAAVIVVDNDHAQSARDVVGRHPSVSYAVEPQRGIATARNTSVRAALRHKPWAIAFIDDDELPAEDWLASLRAAMLTFHADAVTGPVFFDLSGHPPAAIVTDQYLRTPLRSSGDEVKYVATNNTLVRASWLEVFAFDPSFDLTGGSDLELFLRLQLAGARCVWTTDARVSTHVPAERLTLAWNLQRELRNGQLMGRLRMKIHGHSRAAVGMEGLRRMLRGIRGELIGVCLPRRKTLRSRLWVADGLGWLRAANGSLYEEYVRSPTTEAFPYLSDENEVPQ